MARLTRVLLLTAPTAIETTHGKKNVLFRARFRQAAESFAQRLHKGSVFASGRLQSRTWRDAEEKTHHKTDIQVRNLQILEREESESDLSGSFETPENGSLTAA